MQAPLGSVLDWLPSWQDFKNASQYVGPQPPWWTALFPPVAGVYGLTALNKITNLVNTNGGGPGDIAANVVTGKPTQAQIDYNSQQAIAQIQQMRQLYPNNVPAGAEQQVIADQLAYTNLIGGTAGNLFGISGSSGTDYSWLLLLVGAGVALYALVS